MRYTCLIGLLACWAVAGNAAAVDKLVLKEEAFIHGPKVLLGDIARIEGDNAEALAAIELSPAANPGDSKQFNQALVTAKLESAGFDPLEVEMKGAPKVRATTLHLEVSPAQVTESLRDFIMTEMPWEVSEVAIDIQAPSTTVLTADGDMQIQWSPSPQYKYIGPGTFRGTILVDGQVQKTMMVKSYVDAYAQVLVARHDVQRGAIISANDVELAKISLVSAPEAPLQDTSEVVGRLAKKTLLAGQPLLARNLDLPLAIKRNQVVSVEVSVGGVLIQGRARALTEGRVGDPVMCANVDSKQQFQGVVRKDGVVVVE